MPLINVTDPKKWDGFIASQPRSQFTQSWAWGEFRVSQGQAIERLALMADDGAWETAALFIHYPKPLVGGYWYAPRGPVAREGLDASGAVARFLSAIEQKGLPQRAMFWRIEPSFAQGASEGAALAAHLVRSHAYMPATTLLVDLSKGEEELMKEMHEKTRYNIRVAERHGVTVREASGPGAIEAFLKLNDETAARDGFVSQPSDYIRATYESLAAHGMARLRFAEKDGAVLAASLEVVYGDTVTYLYGASSSQARNTMAPYALHWDAIRSAKAAGKKFYDFHGVNPADASSPYFKKTWEGITRFKIGWGGERVDYAGTWELPRMKLAYHAFRLISR
jgi:peptidoglycan pentaglycine glycine transferase (the first glycine)